jgi:hypothetical protein
MDTVARSEILPIGEYELVRPHFRARVIEEKRARRIRLGEHLSVVFENHDSVLLQIQEMLRTERITAEPAILHEIETYNDLIPGPGQVSVTVFVEIADKEVRDRALVDLAGLEETIGLEIDGVVYPFSGPRPAGYQSGRTTAVHYLKATPGADAVAKIKARAAKAALVAAHAGYAARAELGAAALAGLAADLG